MGLPADVGLGVVSRVLVTRARHRLHPKCAAAACWPLPLLLGIGGLLAPPAEAKTYSLFENNPAARRDYVFALNWWGKDPIGTTCNQARREVTSWPWPPNGIGDAWRSQPSGLADFCEMKIRYGIGHCLRRLTIIHELGHWFGLRFPNHPPRQPEHSLDPTSVMFPVIPVLWAMHPELCPWTTPPPPPPNLYEWIAAMEAQAASEAATESSRSPGDALRRPSAIGVGDPTARVSTEHFANHYEGSP